jgi:hypothetical protein
VLAKGRTALVIYGDGHLFRHSPFESIVTIVERSGGKAFTVATITEVALGMIDGAAERWTSPHVERLPGTTWATLPVTTLMPSYRQAWLGTMGSQFDAVLYFGAPSAITFSQLPRSLCADRRYLEKRRARIAMFPFLESEGRRLELLCQSTPATIPANRRLQPFS